MAAQITTFKDYFLQYPEDADDVYYIVVVFGCNSTANDMWYPQTMGFTTFDKAYEYYLKVKPDEADLDNYAERHIPVFNQTELNKSSVLIDACKQTAGYPHRASRDDGTTICYAKRPYGAALSRVKMN